MSSKKSKKFNLVKKYYDMGLWILSRVRLAVKKSWISEEEYKEITGEEYSEEQE